MCLLDSFGINAFRRVTFYTECEIGIGRAQAIVVRRSESSGVSQQGTSAMSNRSTLRPLLAVIVPLGMMLSMGAVIFLFFAGGMRQVNEFLLFRPPLVRAEGVVLMGGRPLPTGQIITMPEDPTLPGAVGFLDITGHFVLQTLIDGKLIDGAYAGPHRVTVTAHENLGDEPMLLTPEKCADFETTDLNLKITGILERDIFLEVAIETDTALFKTASLPEQQALYKIVPLFQEFDLDRNDRLSQSEIAAIASNRKADFELENSDTDEDGEVSRAELVRVTALAMGLTEENAGAALDLRDIEPIEGPDMSIDMNARLVTQRVLLLFDTDEDKELSFEEIDEIEHSFKTDIAAADSDGNEIVNAEELYDYLFAMGKRLMQNVMPAGAGERPDRQSPRKNSP